MRYKRVGYKTLGHVTFSAKDWTVEQHESTEFAVKSLSFSAEQSDAYARKIYAVVSIKLVNDGVILDSIAILCKLIHRLSEQYTMH